MADITLNITVPEGVITGGVVNAATLTSTITQQSLNVVSQVGADGIQGPPGATGAAGVVQTVVGGTNATVDATDPANPIINVTGGGAVDSVNTQTGVVVLDADDIDDTSTTNKFATAAEKATIANQSGTNTGDQDISDFETTTELNARDTANRARTNHTGTQTASTISDFDTEVSNNASVTANTAKVTNATHTGDVTGSTALTIANGAVDLNHLSATGTTDATTFLRGDNTWGTPDDGVDGTGTANQIAYFSDTDTIQSGSGLTYDGTDFAVDTSTFFVDGTTKKVGLGTAAPDSYLEVNPVSDITYTSNQSVLRVTGTVTGSANGARGAYFTPTVTGSGNGPGGLGVQPRIEPTANIGIAYGTINLATVQGSNNVTNLYANFYRSDSDGSYSGTVTNNHTLRIQQTNYSGNKPTTQYGISMGNQGASGMTTSYGLYLDDQSGATNSYSAYFGTGNVGFGEATPGTAIHIGHTNGTGAITYDEQTSTPANPSSSDQARTYVKADKFIIQFNDGGTTRYKYLDLTSTGVTWTHTTTAP